MQNYIATQTDKGFYIEFEDNYKLPQNISYEEVEQFVQKFNNTLNAGIKPDFSEKEKLILSLWEMLLIPDNSIH